MTKEEFVLLALKYLDYPSVKYTKPEEGCGPCYFDCSGFANFLFKKINYLGHIPRHCNEFFDSFGIFVHNRRPGDLVFFSKTSKGEKPDHMGIMISSTHYIHAPGKYDTVVGIKRAARTKIEPINTGYENQLYFVNPIGFKRPMLKKGRYHREFFEEK